jgi:hypothetical protein
MTDPEPDQEPALNSGYNTNPRPRSRKKFKLFAAPKEPEGFYSPFWPLLVVFMAFVLMFLFEISTLRGRALMMHLQITHMQEALQKANAQTAFIQGLHADIAGLAPTHPIAAAILKEYFPPQTQSPVDPGDASKTSPAPDTTTAKPPDEGSVLPPATAPPHP